LDCCHCGVINTLRIRRSRPPGRLSFCEKKLDGSPTNEIPSVLEKLKPKTQAVASLKLCDVIQLNSICTLSMSVSDAVADRGCPLFGRFQSRKFPQAPTIFQTLQPSLSAAFHPNQTT
jgi:hypothetical protein